MKLHYEPWEVVGILRAHIEKKHGIGWDVLYSPATNCFDVVAAAKKSDVQARIERLLNPEEEDINNLLPTRESLE